MKALVYVAHFLYLMSYFVQDMLRLRVLTIVAATVLIEYSYFQPRPMMTVVYWNVFIIVLNVFHLGRILAVRPRGSDLAAHMSAALKSNTTNLLASSKGWSLTGEITGQ